MSDSVILEKLDGLSGEIRDIKADILHQMREEIRAEVRAEVRAEKLHQEVTATPSAVEGDGTQLREVCQTLLTSLEELQGATGMIKAGTELAEDLSPVVQQAYPNAIKFCNELEGEFDFDQLAVTLRKALTSLDSIGEGLDMLKAGVELRNDMIPILQLAYPKMLRALSALHEGEFRAERVGDLLHTVLMNIQTLSDLLNMVQPVTELVKEVGVLMQQTNTLDNLNKWLHNLQTTSPILRIAETIATTAGQLDLNEEKINTICQTIQDTDFKNAPSLGVFGLAQQLRSPEVQKSLGFIFMILQTTGTCLHAWDVPESAEGQQ